MRENGIEAVAVCLLHSYANPAHEARVGAILRAAMPELRITLSARICPEMREYERGSRPGAIRSRGSALASTAMPRAAVGVALRGPPAPRHAAGVPQGQAEGVERSLPPVRRRAAWRFRTRRPGRETRRTGAAVGKPYSPHARELPEHVPRNPAFSRKAHEVTPKASLKLRVLGIELGLTLRYPQSSALDPVAQPTRKCRAADLVTTFGRRTACQSEGRRRLHARSGRAQGDPEPACRCVSLARHCPCRCPLLVPPVSHHDPGPDIRNILIAKLAAPSDGPEIVSLHLSRESILSLVGTGEGIPEAILRDIRDPRAVSTCRPCPAAARLTI
ncbi:hydantoinase/oxoprolinase N-terminal domain-containing protein [Paracoccus mutanolyticus]|uniref:hydantoinase/oxoprolinase N-terminal domain-containing protein n=1 Tax=Paracoccus mutanolyticus TaxID=1499308 RepID=UPI001CB94C21|nr:hydantoinase/oxoprolinase N-terminal domain-containing protein [Paracoccus mutanolyticus]